MTDASDSLAVANLSKAFLKEFMLPLIAFGAVLGALETAYSKIGLGHASVIATLFVAFVGYTFYTTYKMASKLANEALKQQDDALKASQQNPPVRVQDLKK